KVFDPGGGSLIDFTGPPGELTLGAPGWVQGLGITAHQAFFDVYESPLIKSKVVNSGPDGLFGTADDVTAYFLHPGGSPRAGQIVSGEDIRISGNRMLVGEGAPPSLY